MVSFVTEFHKLLFVLEINSLLVASFADIFSQFVGCLSFLLWFPLLCKSKSVIRPHLFIFVFISITVGDRSKKILLQFMSKSVLPVFSSRIFIVPSLTLRSLIHFEFIFIEFIELENVYNFVVFM